MAATACGTQLFSYTLLHNLKSYGLYDDPATYTQAPTGLTLKVATSAVHAPPLPPSCSRGVH